MHEKGFLNTLNGLRIFLMFHNSHIKHFHVNYEKGRKLQIQVTQLC
jgi:hypothetical protein